MEWLITINYSCGGVVMKTRNVLLATMLVCMFGFVAQAQIVRDSAFGNGADTFVGNDSNKDYQTNFGSGTYRGGMDIRYYTGVRCHIGIFRIDISQVSNMSGATLELFLSDSGGARTWSVYGLNDGAVDENWDESTITYDNFSGFLNTSPVENGNYVLGDMTMLGTVAVPGTDNTAVSSNTTDLNLDSFLSADTDGLVTFAIISAGDSAQAYVMTKEGMNDPANNPDWNGGGLYGHVR